MGDDKKKSKGRDYPLSETPNPNDFGSKFNEAKKSGAKDFNYGGKKYTTQSAQDIAKKQTMEQNEASLNKAAKDAQLKFFKNKGLNKVADTYQEAASEQWFKKYSPNGIRKTKGKY